ncbi:hypothetical protein [Sphingobacterium paludis]|uniref:Uncharacterized protein n=1 Tax=Sphingobacterium paludis TaxID=1476465 RepID=A0A4R7CYX1_9SPHI|nr:hypothetical protein [Sphingobacterium paludis]TDS12345.1 hypothetical protein B0I21_106203 [Sphingobacterium paludis]
MTKILSLFWEKFRERQSVNRSISFLIYDGFAVSPKHVLIISKLLQEDYFALSVAEKADFA